jgi:hypothetical protein
MAWSPPALIAGIVWVSAPGDYATLNSNHTPDGTGCTDPPGFDRAAFHKEFNVALLAFFRANLDG